MGNNPHQNKAAVTAKLQEVKAHPMCLSFEDTGSSYRVIYPSGDEFWVDGLHATYLKLGKLAALERLLEVMEKHWLESFPGSKA